MTRLTTAIRLAITSPKEFGRAVRFRNGSPRFRNLERLVSERKPQTIVEIGVWRAETGRRMIQAATRHRSDVCYWGFDLFEAVTDEILDKDSCLKTFISGTTLKPMTISEAKLLLDGLGAHVTLVAGDSTKTLPVTTLPPIDFAFIDGGHTYETVSADWRNLRPRLSPGALVVFDDYTNEDAVEREDFGVRTLIDELRSEYRVDLLSPVDTFQRPYGALKTRLAVITIS